MLLGRGALSGAGLFAKRLYLKFHTTTIFSSKNFFFNLKCKTNVVDKSAHGLKTFLFFHNPPPKKKK